MWRVDCGGLTLNSVGKLSGNSNDYRRYDLHYTTRISRQPKESSTSKRWRFGSTKRGCRATLGTCRGRALKFSATNTTRKLTSRLWWRREGEMVNEWAKISCFQLLRARKDWNKSSREFKIKVWNLSSSGTTIKWTICWKLSNKSRRHNRCKSWGPGKNGSQTNNWSEWCRKLNWLTN